MKIFTIGFTKKSAEEFFSRLQNSGASRVVDVRLNNVSQLAGFAKKDDLQFFLREIAGMEYMHLPVLAPTQAMLDAYRKQKGGWASYERAFLKLIEERQIAKVLSREVFDAGCLLCSEDAAEHCHRRVIAEYLQERWKDVVIVHL